MALQRDHNLLVGRVAQDEVPREETRVVALEHRHAHLVGDGVDHAVHHHVHHHVHAREFQWRETDVLLVLDGVDEDAPVRVDGVSVVAENALDALRAVRIVARVLVHRHRHEVSVVDVERVLLLRAPVLLVVDDVVHFHGECRRNHLVNVYRLLPLNHAAFQIHSGVGGTGDLLFARRQRHQAATALQLALLHRLPPRLGLCDLRAQQGIQVLVDERLGSGGERNADDVAGYQFRSVASDASEGLEERLAVVGQAEDGSGYRLRSLRHSDSHREHKVTTATHITHQATGDEQKGQLQQTAVLS